jgi:hypothetical protein
VRGERPGTDEPIRRHTADLAQGRQDNGRKTQRRERTDDQPGSRITAITGHAERELAGVTPWNGTDNIAWQVYAKISQSFNEGDDLLIVMPWGGTDQTDPNGDPVLWEEIMTSGPIWVTLTTDGGSNGSVDDTTGVITNTSYTYTAVGLDGATLGTMLTPVWNRPGGPLTGPASHGMGLISAGAFVLQFTDEQPLIYGCQTSDG